MADWVHCNLCFKQPGGERKFSLTNCGHIYCEECLPSGKNFHAKIMLDAVGNWLEHRFLNLKARHSSFRSLIEYALSGCMLH